MGFDLNFEVSDNLTSEQKDYLRKQFLIDAEKEGPVPEDVFNFLVDTPSDVEHPIVVKRELATVDFSELNELFANSKVKSPQRRINITENKYSMNTETMSGYTRGIGVAA
ncbi:hypothetical protein PVS71_07730 [Pediococcus acidilactici]|uniref:hypothetical protein n=1 Tax=Pediococcus acidilactici TaxID=1254 RepID=UPI00237EF94C|nr:hypothetical protein [Pediococcus acidilactici]WDV24852.1 hypothetical protein PVS71_07730 [Pediococcus acidilactici]WEE13917.1 hypothetical protein PX336_07730 [Pediococcus acidilactici]